MEFLCRLPFEWTNITFPATSGGVSHSTFCWKRTTSEVVNLSVFPRCEGIWRLRGLPDATPGPAHRGHSLSVHHVKPAIRPRGQVWLSALHPREGWHTWWRSARDLLFQIWPGWGNKSGHFHRKPQSNTVHAHLANAWDALHHPSNPMYRRSSDTKLVDGLMGDKHHIGYLTHLQLLCATTWRYLRINVTILEFHRQT